MNLPAKTTSKLEYIFTTKTYNISGKLQEYNLYAFIIITIIVSFQTLLWQDYMKIILYEIQLKILNRKLKKLNAYYQLKVPNKNQNYLIQIVCYEILAFD